MTLNNHDEFKINILPKKVECPICFEDINESEYSIMDCCNQSIHNECLESWSLFKKNNKCVLCRGKNKVLNLYPLNNNIDIIEREYNSDVELDNENLINQELLRETRNNRRIRLFVYQTNCRIFLNILCLLFLFILIILILSKNSNIKHI